MTGNSKRVRWGGGGTGWSSRENMVVYLQNICPRGQDIVRMPKWNLISNWSLGNTTQQRAGRAPLSMQDKQNWCMKHLRAQLNTEYAGNKGTFVPARFTHSFTHTGWSANKAQPSTCATLGNSTSKDLNWNVLMNLLLQFSPLALIIGDCQERHHWLIIVACLCFWNEMWNNLSDVQSSLHYFLLKTAMTALRYVQILKMINHVKCVTPPSQPWPWRQWKHG